MEQLTQKLINDNSFISAINNVVKGEIRKEFNQRLGDPTWRYRIFKLILQKEISDNNLDVFLHAVLNGLPSEDRYLTLDALEAMDAFRHEDLPSKGEDDEVEDTKEDPEDENSFKDYLDFLRKAGFVMVK